MTKIVLNNCYGGFNLSNDAIELYFELSGETPHIVTEGEYKFYYKIPDWNTFQANGYIGDDLSATVSRTDPILVEVVEQFAKAESEAGGYCSRLIVLDIPAGSHYRICEGDGLEWIEYRDQVQWEVA